MCKHIHAVALFERRSEFVSSTSNNAECSEEGAVDIDVLYVDEPSTSQMNYQNDLNHYIQESHGSQNSNTTINFATRRQIALGEVCNYCNTLDEKSFDEFMDVIRKFKNNLERKNDLCKKRKIEKQLYYPNKP